MRILGFTLLFAGFAWACVSVPLYRGAVTGTTSVSLEVLQGKGESLTRKEVYSAFVRHDEEMKRLPWTFFAPAFVIFCGGLLLGRRPPGRAG